MRSNGSVLVGSKVRFGLQRGELCFMPNYGFRVLAVGWNNHFVEFPDTHENDVSVESNWVTCHTDDVFAAAVRYPEVPHFCVLTTVLVSMFDVFR